MKLKVFLKFIDSLFSFFSLIILIQFSFLLFLLLFLSHFSPALQGTVFRTEIEKFSFHLTLVDDFLEVFFSFISLSSFFLLLTPHIHL